MGEGGMGAVLDRILKALEGSPLHMTLLDPAKQTPKEAGKIAAAVGKAGSDALMIGGSTGVNERNLDQTVIAVKESTGIPVILFPSGAGSLSRHADAVYFMSMLNSQDARFLIGEQVKGAQVVKKLGLEPISMGYIIVEPGMEVGRVGRAQCIRRDDLAGAVGYALAGEYLGMRLIYLEAGSGSPTPVPPKMIRCVKDQLGVPLIAGGGIRTPAHARAAVEAGADIVVTGTMVEETSDVGVKVHELIDAVKGR